MKVNDYTGSYQQFKVKVADQGYSNIQSLASSIKHEDSVATHLAATTHHQPIISHFKLSIGKQPANGSHAFNNNVSPKMSHQTSYEPISPIDGDITDEGG